MDEYVVVFWHEIDGIFLIGAVEARSYMEAEEVAVQRYQNELLETPYGDRFVVWSFKFRELLEENIPLSMTHRLTPSNLN